MLRSEILVRRCRVADVGFEREGLRKEGALYVFSINLLWNALLQKAHEYINKLSTLPVNSQSYSALPVAERH
ncbi:hypothetical protein PILCRDRAFT_810103 [Piloderma croceum F 1598]|uniref:Uncharacterized protein n=1 Tax=Piloderma croceum (strain F 1598) TaxID=765440 RepID=A0A0C3BZV3_PILCF|nr:hypothetical protein PILCRDRAFT_810103 [Piloderma croceum F 1598]